MFSNELRKIFSGFTTKVGLFLGGLGVPANFITFLVLVSGFGAGYCIYLAEFYWAIFLILFSGLMDAFDGAVAKANHKESKFGGLLDSTTAKITEISWYIAFGFLNPVLWPVMALAITFFMLSSYISKHAKASGGKSGGGIMERKERLVLIILALLLPEYIFYFISVIVILSLITALQRFHKNYKILRSLQ